MFCALVGIVPPDPDLAKHVQEQVRVLAIEDNDSVSIHWRPSYSVAPDQDQDGVMTLLLTAISDDPATPESIVAAVEQVATKWWSDNTDNDKEEETAVLSVELWASAPAPLPLCPLDGYDKYITAISNEGDTSSTSDKFCPMTTNAMRSWGLVHQPQILTATGVAEFVPVIAAAIASTEKALALHQPQLQVGQDSFCFREIASRNQERFDLRLPTSLTSETGALVHKHILSNPHVLQFLQSTMGLASTNTSSSIIGNEKIDFDLSVVYSRPGACAQGWHADGSHVRGAPDAGWDQDSKTTQQTSLADPYAVCLFVPLIDLNDTVGYTQFWPGSHQHRGLVGFGPVAQVTSSVWNGSCKAGDGVWYDYRLLHQGMPNTSDSNIVRPVLQIIFKKKWYVERANYGVESLYNTNSSSI